MEVTLCERMGGGGAHPTRTVPLALLWRAVHGCGGLRHCLCARTTMHLSFWRWHCVAQLDPRVLRRLLCVSLAHVPQSILAYLETHRVVIYIVRTARGFFPVVLHEVAPLALAPACCHSVFLAPVLMQHLAPSR